MSRITIKRIITYVFGLFILSFGVSFSIQAGLGVSPVSSLAVAFSLTSGISVGVTTVIANMLFIIVQVILKKRINLRDFGAQLIVAFLFGFFIDATLLLLRLFPTPDTFVFQSLFLVISIFLVALGLLGYFTGQLPLMPYDALTHTISNQFKLKFGRAKITSDSINVFFAGALCLGVIHSFGSIGVGTVITAYFLGKVLGWLLHTFQPLLNQWIYKVKGENHSDLRKKQVL